MDNCSPTFDKLVRSGEQQRLQRAGARQKYDRLSVMRGEHFLLLAEREQLLAPVVLTQLRRILAQQRRPATGEAVARLLVDRSFLTVEQARRLIEAGSGTGSPLVPAVAVMAPVVAAAALTRAAHQSEELLLAPDGEDRDTSTSARSRTLAAAPPSQRGLQSPAGQTPMIPTDIALAELTDSLERWMDLPGTLDWNVPPSSIFAPPKWQVPPTMVLVGVGGFLVLFLLVVLVAINRWSAG